jgi:NAD(P)H-hydrate epimerase
MVAVPRGILPVVQASLTEAVFVPLDETVEGTVAGAALDTVLETLARADALALGPGLSSNEETAGFVRDLVRSCPVPMVVDADGLNAFAGRAADIADRKSDAVLTPHAGEFARLTGVTARDLQDDRLKHARSLAVGSNAVALLKGSRTVIASPGGQARVNPTGSAVLATAGSGDVLTGVIGGLIARGVAPMEAAASAAYLHGLAGMLAGRRSGEGTLAGDLVAHLPEAVARIEDGS